MAKKRSLDKTIKSNPETIFRPAYEYYAAIFWLYMFVVYCVLTILILDVNYLSLPIIPSLIGCSIVVQVFSAFNRAKPIIQAQIDMFVVYPLFVTSNEFREINGIDLNAPNKRLQNSKLETLLGEGFEWGAEHANMAYKIYDLHSDLGDLEFPRPVIRAMKKNEDTTKEMGGLPWIFNIGIPSRIMTEIYTWYGHTIIFGNVGTGKTTLLKLRAVGSLHLGNVVAFFDPKNDNDVKVALREECRLLGLPYYEFNPSKGSTSVAIDPIRNFEREAEVATRITGVLQEGGKQDAFSNYGWMEVYRATLACTYIGIRPTLIKLYSFLTVARTKMFESVMNEYYKRTFGDNWLQTMSATLTANGLELLEGQITYYEKTLCDTKPDSTAGEIVASYRNPPEHHKKMMASIIPMFANLTAAPLDELLSPEPSIENKRKVIDLQSLFDKGGAIHVAIDSLKDPHTAQKLIQLFVGDLSSIAGARYNASGLENSNRVSLFFDEAHMALCDQLLSMLAQSRAAKMEMTVTTQTYPDLASKTNESIADRVLGLCNNIISTRVNDPKTQEKVSANFGQTGITSVKTMYSQNASTSSNLTDFGGGMSQTVSKTKDASFPTYMLGDLPKLQAVCRLSNGKRYLFKIPIVTYEV